MKIITDIGIQVPQVYLPKAGTDLKKWAVIACDQFTSEPEYWRDVEKTVGDAPSTLNLTFPEVYLEKPSGEERIQNIQAAMRKYMDEGINELEDTRILENSPFDKIGSPKNIAKLFGGKESYIQAVRGLEQEIYQMV